MKTDKEWFKHFESDEVQEDLKKVEGNNEGFFAFMCKKIQLDAMKEGMRRAAKCIETAPYGTNAQGNYLSEREAILAAAEQLTEKDL